MGATLVHTQYVTRRSIAIERHWSVNGIPIDHKIEK